MRVRVLFVLFLLLAMPLFAQEDFGDFGLSGSGGDFDDTGFGFSSSSGPAVKISGEAKAELTLFFDDMSSSEKRKIGELGDIFSGSLNFDASGSAAEAVIKLKLVPVFDGSSPIDIDEAYVRAFFGPLTIQGGLRKLSWGKADSFGPLDVINPIDYSDLTKLSDPQSVKIARPLIHASWSLGAFSKLEAVFVPWFEGHRFDTTGRWTPGQITILQAKLPKGGAAIKVEGLYPETNALRYFQAGARFTTTIGSSDFGFQYYYGMLSRPAVSFYLEYPSFDTWVPTVGYNPYQQFGVDFARVIAGFNLRAEAGINMTGDFDGTKKGIENPALVWSLGFDRDLVWGINLNLQGTGKIRLFHGKINSDPYFMIDCEAGTDMTSTRITAKVSRKFLRDELELKTTALWGIEDKDFLIMPAIVWSRNDVSTELAAGFFGGDKSGELGQYRDNAFVRVSLSYTF